MCTPDCAGRQCGPDGCGAQCGPPCSNGELCSDGQCTREPCRAGTFECAGRCADLLSDIEHCGSCGSACPDGADQNGFPACVNAVCEVKCGDGPDGPFVPDLANDLNNCGACGNSCPDPLGGEARCSRGVCLDPCSADRVICDNRCTYPEAGSNCVGADACCPVVAEGQFPVPVVQLGRSHAVRVQLAQRRRLQARLTFNDGSCPGYRLTPLPQALESERFTFSLMATNSRGQPNRLARGIKPKRDDTACALLDVDLDAGAYYLYFEAHGGDTGPATVTWRTLDPAPLAEVPARVVAAGSYRVNVPANAVDRRVNLRLAQPSNLRLRYRERVADYEPMRVQGSESCTGVLVVTSAAEPGYTIASTQCGEVDQPLPAGDFVVHLRNSLPTEGEGRLEVNISPLNQLTRAVQATEIVQLNQALAAGQIHVLNFASAGALQRFRIRGPGCAEVVTALVDGEGRHFDGKSVGDPCDEEYGRNLQPGPWSLWLYQGELRQLPAITVQLNGVPDDENLRYGTRDMPALDPGEDAILFIEVDRRSGLVIAVKGPDNTCPGQASLLLSDEFSQPVAFDEFSGVAGCPTLRESVAAGRYRLRVRGLNNRALPAYQLSLSND